MWGRWVILYGKKLYFNTSMYMEYQVNLTGFHELFSTDYCTLNLFLTKSETTWDLNSKMIESNIN